MDKKPIFSYRGWQIAAGLVLLIVCCPITTAAGDTQLDQIPGKSDTNLIIANNPDGCYLKFNQPYGGGLNALHISANAAEWPNYGQVTTTDAQSGTFYITDTGGRGYQDRAFLLVAVKGDIPDDFSIRLTSSGYHWAPTGTMNKPPTVDEITYRAGAINETFDRSEFVYGPQTWKPAGLNTPSDYPLYYGQDSSDTTNQFRLMFVDLMAGPLGKNSGLSNLTDYGAVKVDYAIENLDTVVVFNTYVWNDNTTQGRGISWTNSIEPGHTGGPSGYTVLGTEYLSRASEFPTVAGSAPTYRVPETNFTANITSGPVPLAVQFNDLTGQSAKAWLWEFGDGETSTDQNPVHVYESPGVFTVNLTVSTAQGTNATTTEADLINAGPIGSENAAFSQPETTAAGSTLAIVAVPVAIGFGLILRRRR